MPQTKRAPNTGKEFTYGPGSETHLQSRGKELKGDANKEALDSVSPLSSPGD